MRSFLAKLAALILGGATTAGLALVTLAVHNFLSNPALLCAPEEQPALCLREWASGAAGLLAAIVGSATIVFLALSLRQQHRQFNKNISVLTRRDLLELERESLMLLADVYAYLRVQEDTAERLSNHPTHGVEPSEIFVTLFSNIDKIFPDERLDRVARQWGALDASLLKAFKDSGWRLMALSRQIDIKHRQENQDLSKEERVAAQIAALEESGIIRDRRFREHAQTLLVRIPKILQEQSALLRPPAFG